MLAVALDAFRVFHKSVDRMTLLYEVTIHSYQLMYDSGRERLKNKAARNDKIEIRLQTRNVTRQLKLLTFQARDVYPQLLRSTPLIRLVAVYEAFLIDTILEVSRRSDLPFMSERRVEMAQSQMLFLDSKGEIKEHIVQRTTRQLTSGGLEEIKKFYSASLKIDLVAPDQTFGDLAEVHERRHLYVHSSGYADAAYCHRFPQPGGRPGQLLPVDEAYLLKATKLLMKSALHIRDQVEIKYPPSPPWRYAKGVNTLESDQPLLVVATARVEVPSVIERLLDLESTLDGGLPAKEIVIWVGTDDQNLRWLLGGSQKDVKAFFEFLAQEQRAGMIANLESFKVKR
jgi:hypothetical protein